MAQSGLGPPSFEGPIAQLELKWTYAKIHVPRSTSAPCMSTPRSCQDLGVTYYSPCPSEGKARECGLRVGSVGDQPWLCMGRRVPSSG